jgi:hypothetical protein
LVYAAIIFLVFLTSVMVHPNFLLADGDTNWHLVVGERIVRDHAFPVVDQFSHTQAGAPWIAKEWLSQVFLYQAYSIGGWLGVVRSAGGWASPCSLHRLRLSPGRFSLRGSAGASSRWSP